MRKAAGRNQRGILNPHAVMHFVSFFQSAQDGGGLLNIRLVHENWLKPSFQRGIFFNMLSIFVRRGRADGAQFSACERRL